MNLHQKIIVTGAEGQLAQALKKAAIKSKQLFFVSKEEMDITNRETVNHFFEKHQPTLLINTAAYTKVDEAEKNKDLAFAVNCEAVKILADACVKFQSKLIHLSTDYVFDGKATIPYKETAPANPVTVYGKSKYDGEKAILNSGLKEFAIIRTSWLYSEFGHNFYKTMLHLAASQKEINVVNDQQGCPTYAPDLARAILKISENLNKVNSGIYHFTNQGQTTWYDFAKAIFEKNKISILVNPIPTFLYPTPAKRPAYSVLDSQKTREVFQVETPHWTERI